MATLTRVGMLSLAKLQGVIMAIVGLIAGILYSFGGAIYDVLTIGLNLGTALAFMALIGMPIIFATCGFIAGGIGALLYNVFAKRAGGIEMEMDFTE